MRRLQDATLLLLLMTLTLNMMSCVVSLLTWLKDVTPSEELEGTQCSCSIHTGVSANFVTVSLQHQLLLLLLTLPSSAAADPKQGGVLQSADTLKQ